MKDRRSRAGKRKKGRGGVKEIDGEMKEGGIRDERSREGANIRKMKVRRKMEE